MVIVGKPPGVGRRSFLVKLGRGLCQAAGPAGGASPKIKSIRIFDGDRFRSIQLEVDSAYAATGAAFLQRNRIALSSVCEYPRIGPRLESVLEKLGELVEKGEIKGAEDLSRPFLRNWGRAFGYVIMGIVRNDDLPQRRLEVFYCDERGMGRCTQQDMVFARIYGGRGRQ
jgi:hypothetical protein